MTCFQSVTLTNCRYKLKAVGDKLIQVYRYKYIVEQTAKLTSKSAAKHRERIERFESLQGQVYIWTYPLNTSVHPPYKFGCRTSHVAGDHNSVEVFRLSIHTRQHQIWLRNLSTKTCLHAPIVFNDCDRAKHNLRCNLLSLDHNGLM